MNIADIFKKPSDPITPNAGGDFVYQAAAKGQQNTLQNVPDVKKYVNRGITPVANENLDLYLPATQSTFTKLGNSLAQTLISELTLGTLRGISDMTDAIIGGIMRGITGEKNDFSNPVSDFLAKQQENFRNFAPVYADPRLNIGNGGLKDAGWWLSNAPSIISSLTLLIPGAGVVKGVSAAGKALRVGSRTRALLSSASGAAKRIEKGKDLNKFQKFIISDNTAKGTSLFLENTANAALSRTIENYQEASQVNNDMYIKSLDYLKDDDNYKDYIKRNKKQLEDKGIDPNDKEAIAKDIASEAAKETFTLDYANVVFDIAQMYALRNAWSRIRNAPKSDFRVTAANKQAAKEIGRTEEEISKLNENISKFKKYSSNLKHRAINQGKLILTESTEGIEEAVNYIAQQEGMTLGNTLLTGEGIHSGFWKKTFGGYDDRLQSYLNSPQLWDSAFWGLMGGVVFQSLGSGFKRMEATFAEKADKQLSKNEAKADEETKANKTPWYYIAQVPEIKRRIEDIRRRNERFNSFKNDLNDINKGIDIFQEKENRKEGQLDSEELKEAARQRAFKDYVTDITLSALNNGNYDLLKAYLQDENVLKGIADSGIFNTSKDANGNIIQKPSTELYNDSKKFIDNAVKYMEKVADQFDIELDRLNMFTASRKFKGRVSQEVLNIIASDNIKYNAAIDQEKDNINYYNSQIAKKIAYITNNEALKDKFDPNANYENTIRLSVIGTQLGILRNRRKNIAKEPDSISKSVALSNIDKQIEFLERNLNDDELTFVTARSLQITGIDELTNKIISDSSNDEFLEYFNSIIINNGKKTKNGKLSFEHLDSNILKLNPKALKPIDDSRKESYKKISLEASKAYKSLENVDEELANLYSDKIISELTIGNYSSLINSDFDSVADRIGIINNTLNQARITAIEKSSDILLDLYSKYGQKIRDIVKAEYEGEDVHSVKALYSDMDYRDAKQMQDALKVLELTKSYNKNVAASIESAFNEADRIDKTKQRNAELNGEVEKSTNKKGKSAPQNSPITNPTENPLESNTEEQKGKKTDKSDEKKELTDPNKANPIQQENPIKPEEKETPQETPQETPVEKDQTDSDVINKINDTNNVFNGSRQIGSAQLAKINGVYQLVVPLENGTKVLTNYIKDKGVTSDNTIKNIANSDLYDNEGVDITRPWNIEKYPVVKTKSGSTGLNYYIAEKGKVVNTDTIDYKNQQEEKKAQQSTEFKPGDVVTFDGNRFEIIEDKGNYYRARFFGDANSEVKIKKADVEAGLYEKWDPNTYYDPKTRSWVGSKENSTSTNEQAAKPKQQPQNPEEEEFKGTADLGYNVTEEINRTALLHKNAIAENKIRRAFMPIYMKNKNMTLDQIEAHIDNIIDELVTRNEDRSTLESAKPSILAFFKRRIEKKYKNKVDSTTDELLLEEAIGVYENGDVNLFRIDYVTKLNELLDVYCKELGVPTINNKKYINLEDFFRYLNKNSKDNLTATILYSGVNEYLKTPEAKTKYIRTDDLNDNIQDATDKIIKSEETRQSELIKEDNPQRINLDPFALKYADEDTAKEMEDAFLSSNIGDELIYEIEDDKIIFKTKDGKLLGTNTLPRIDETTGIKTMKIANFVYDLDKTSDGHITSKLKNAIIRWFTSDDDSCKQLRALLYSYVYENKTNKEKQLLVQEFANNIEIKNAIEEGLILSFTKGDIQEVMTMDHLGKLFKYRNIKNTLDDRFLKYSIDAWFDKIYENYEYAKYLSENPNTPIKISNISDGKIIRNTDDITTANLKQHAIPATEAIGGGVNIDVNRITITDNNYDTMVAGSTPVHMGFNRNTTHVTVLNRNGSVEYVAAIPSTVIDKFIGDKAKEIVSALENNIYKLLDNYIADNSVTNFKALKNFLLNAFNYKNYSTIFYNVSAFTAKGENNSEIIVIRRKDKNGNEYKLRFLPNNTVDITRPEYEENENAFRERKGLNVNDKDVKRTLKDIINNLRFNINETLINSDSLSTDPSINGILSKKNGKFIITIGDDSWEFNSFNEFVLTQNLVSLNTHPSDNGSNFIINEFSSIEYSISKLENKVEEKEDTSTPVEESQPIEIPDNLPETEKVRGILDGSIPVPNDDKALAIYDIITDGNKELLKALNDLELLPKTIIFDEKLNKVKKDENGKEIFDKNGNKVYDGPNAQTNTDTNIVTLGEKWLQRFDLGSYSRQYAGRILIHERIHQLFHDKKHNYSKYSKSITDVFNEFINSINDNSIRNFLKYYYKKKGIDEKHKTYDLSDEIVERYKKVLEGFKYEQYENDIDRRLEEFIVDSMMNETLIEYLNSVQTKTKKGYENLFQKLIREISKLFGWTVEKGSLREKEIYALKDLSKTTKKNTTKKSEKNKNKKYNQPTIPGLFDEEEQNSTQSPIVKETKQEPQQTVEQEIEEDETEEEIEIDADNLDLDIEDDVEDLSNTTYVQSTTNELTLDSTYTPEMQDIKAKAIADGTFMKAPNGNPTNLNERQWLQVRTKAFKNWFGDWENNPSEASKVVDENGEPLVVYHGTKYIFHTFRNKYETYKEEKYLETSEIKKEVLDTFTNKEKNTLIPLINRFEDNPFIALSEFTKSEEELFNKYYDKLSILRNNGKKVIQHYNIGNFFTTDKTYAETYGTNVYSTFLNIRNLKYDDKLHRIYTSDSRINSLQEEGYDGIIGHDVKGRDVESKGIEYLVFNPNQIKSATSNNGEFSKENDDIRYSTTDELSISKVKEDCQNFLDNFGISIDNYPVSEIVDRFDKVNRLINANTAEEITDGVGEAIAFMMQYSKQFNELLTLKNINTPLQYKGIRRASKNNLEINIESKFTNEQRQQAITEIGKDIAEELRKRYNINSKPNNIVSSIMQKVKELINMFFELFTPNVKNQFRVINNNIRNIVDNIILNDPTIINFNNIKPGTFGRESTIVNFEKALTENPYEEGIIYTLNKYGIALAGSGSLATFGVLYRPAENPLHDIDFNAQGMSVSKLENILTNEFKHIYNTNTIRQGEGHTETYLILDRPFKIQHTKDDGTYILDATTGEYLGKYHYSNLKLADDVQGKMLDFFLGNTSPYGNREAELNGKKYLFTDPRNVILAKVTWGRHKDIFDYNRFISKEQKETLDKQKKERTKEIVNRIKRSNVIWASPTIGKTTYIKDHKDEILEWDEEVNPRRNVFLKEQIDPNNTMTKEEYNAARSEYMADLNNHPEYVEFLTNEWNKLKEKSRKENKKIFASPLPLLKLFPNDFDLIINSNENVFLKRNILRGGKTYSTRYWKQDINNILTGLNQDKIITTDLYFSDLMESANKDNDIRYSTTDELVITKASSLLDAKTQLPIQLRSKFDNMVKSAAIKTMCR